MVKQKKRVRFNRQCFDFITIFFVSVLLASVGNELHPASWQAAEMQTMSDCREGRQERMDGEGGERRGYSELAGVSLLSTPVISLLSRMPCGVWLSKRKRQKRG